MTSRGGARTADEADEGRGFRSCRWGCNRWPLNRLRWRSSSHSSPIWHAASAAPASTDVRQGPSDRRDTTESRARGTRTRRLSTCVPSTESRKPDAVYVKRQCPARQNCPGSDGVHAKALPHRPTSRCARSQPLPVTSSGSRQAPLAASRAPSSGPETRCASARHGVRRRSRR